MAYPTTTPPQVLQLDIGVSPFLHCGHLANSMHGEECNFKLQHNQLIRLEIPNCAIFCTPKRDMQCARLILRVHPIPVFCAIHTQRSISKPHLPLEDGIVPVQFASDLHEGHVGTIEKNRADGSEIPLNGSISKPHFLLEGGIGQGYALVSFKTLHVDLAFK
jgi:hypothetical protein